LTTEKARAEQARLSRRVVTSDAFGPVRRVAGVDAHYDLARGRTYAAAVLLDVRGLVLQESALAWRPTTMPYIPGLLSFREAPAMLAVLAALSRKPDLLLVDGQGLAHPRRFGLACHLGVLADLPTIGAAKSRLTGTFGELDTRRGASVPLTLEGETIGAVLRTRADCRPLFVSPGHRISLASAVDWVCRVTPRYRIPEPLRLADRLSRVHGS
jgi:deoxyribonuclease V